MISSRSLLGLLLACSLASGAAAQRKTNPNDLKPPPVLPKMAPPPTLAGMVAAVPDENVLFLDLSTGGRVKIVMRPDAAPNHIERIRSLVRQGFYNGTVFHRVIEGFMAQGGDPTGTGQGGSKLPDLAPEFNDLPHVRGAVSMARAQGLDSANSQFFIVFQPVLKLDRTYTVWGRVVSGMEFVDAIARGEPPETPSKIIKASIATDKAAPPAPATPIPAPGMPIPAPGKPIPAPDLLAPGAAAPLSLSAPLSAPPSSVPPPQRPRG